MFATWQRIVSPRSPLECSRENWTLSGWRQFVHRRPADRTRCSTGSPVGFRPTSKNVMVKEIYMYFQRKKKKIWKLSIFFGGNFYWRFLIFRRRAYFTKFRLDSLFLHIAQTSNILNRSWTYLFIKLVSSKYIAVVGEVIIIITVLGTKVNVNLG